MNVSGNDVLTVSGNDVINGMDYQTMYQAVYDANVDALALQDATDGQAVNSTALNYFTGILGNQVFPVDYVIYVGDAYTYDSGNQQRTAYEYCMLYGDLDCEGTRFTGENATMVTMRVTGMNTVGIEKGIKVDLSAPQYYSRSNLGTYSGVIQYPWIQFLILLFAVLGGLVWFMRKIMRLGY